MNTDDKLHQLARETVDGWIMRSRNHLGVDIPQYWQDALYNDIGSALERAYKDGYKDGANEQPRAERWTALDVLRMIGEPVTSLDIQKIAERIKDAHNATLATTPATEQPRTKTLLRSMIAALDNDDDATFFKCYEMLNDLVSQAAQDEPDPFLVNEGENSDYGINWLIAGASRCLEPIDTVKLAVAGFTDAAERISGARVALDKALAAAQANDNDAAIKEQK